MGRGRSMPHDRTLICADLGCWPLHGGKGMLIVHVCTLRQLPRANELQPGGRLLDLSSVPAVSTVLS